MIDAFPSWIGNAFGTLGIGKKPLPESRRLPLIAALVAGAIGLQSAPAMSADLKELAEQLVNKKDLPPCAEATQDQRCVTSKGAIREGGLTTGAGQIAIGDPGVKQGTKKPTEN